MHRFSVFEDFFVMKRFVIPFLLLFGALTVQAQNAFSEHAYLLDAYLTNNMNVWKAHIDSVVDLPYEYGYCAALMETDREAAKIYVKRFHQHVEQAKNSLPAGHYKMYMSAVWVYELRLHESFHPARALQWAKEAVNEAPEDPLTLTYCGMSLFYAPRPFGRKKEALTYFLRAEKQFAAPEWYNCWWRAAALMYISQCYEKQGDVQKAIRKANSVLAEYPNYQFLKTVYLPILKNR